MAISPRKRGAPCALAVENESTFVGLSIPRQWRLSLASAASSVSTTLTSLDGADSVATAVAIAWRTVGSARGSASHSFEAIPISITGAAARRPDAAVISFPHARSPYDRRLGRCAPPTRGGLRLHG